MQRRMKDKVERFWLCIKKQILASSGSTCAKICAQAALIEKMSAHFWAGRRLCTFVSSVVESLGSFSFTCGIPFACPVKAFVAVKFNTTLPTLELVDWTVKRCNT